MPAFSSPDRELRGFSRKQALSLAGVATALLLTGCSSSNDSRRDAIRSSSVSLCVTLLLLFLFLEEVEQHLHVDISLVRHHLLDFCQRVFMVLDKSKCEAVVLSE